MENLLDKAMSQMGEEGWTKGLAGQEPMVIPDWPEMDLAGKTERDLSAEFEEPKSWWRKYIAHPLGGILDFMQRPTFASAGFFDEFNKPRVIRDHWKGAWDGLRGKDKTTFANVLKNAGVENPWVAGTLGFAADVLMDPLTYVGGHMGRAAYLATKTGAKAGFRLATKVPKAGPQIDRAANILAKWFIPHHGQPKSYVAVQDAVYNTYWNDTDNLISGLKRMAKDLTPQERKYAGDLIEGTVKELPEGVRKSKIDEIKAILGDWGMDELGTGRLSEAEFLKRFGKYYPHYYEGMGRISFKDPSFLKKRAYETLAEADADLAKKGVIIPFFNNLDEANRFARKLDLDIIDYQTTEEARDYFYKMLGGVEPIRDPVRVLGRRGIEHYGMMRWARLIDDSLDISKHVDDGFMFKLDDLMKAKGAADPMDAIKMQFPKGARFFVSGPVALKGKPEKFMHSQFMREIIKTGKYEWDEIQQGVVQKMLHGKKYTPSNIFAVDSTVADDITAFHGMMSKKDALNEFVHMFDKGLNIWKLWATAMNPGFHFRNMYSNWFNNWLGGVKSITPYREAFKFQLGLHQQLKKGNLPASMLKNSIKTKGGLEIPYDELLSRMRERGVFRHGWLGADIASPDMYREIESGIKTGKSFMNPMHWVHDTPAAIGRSMASWIEDNSRVAMFLDAFKKSKAANFADASIEAGNKVKKYLFNYHELTPMERGVFKRILPFYTWTRKNMPLQAESMITQPHKYATVGKVKRMFEHMAGGVTEEEKKNYPDYFDELWAIKSPIVGRKMINTVKAIKDAVMPGYKSFVPDREHPLFINPNLPFQDLNRALDAREWLNSVNPMFKIMLGLSSGVDTFFGSDISKSAYERKKLQKGAPELLWDVLPEQYGGYIIDPDTGEKVKAMNSRFQWFVKQISPFYHNLAKALNLQGQPFDDFWASHMLSWGLGLKLMPLDMERRARMRWYKSKQAKGILMRRLREQGLDPSAPEVQQILQNFTDAEENKPWEYLFAGGGAGLNALSSSPTEDEEEASAFEELYHKGSNAVHPVFRGHYKPGEYRTMEDMRTLFQNGGISSIVNYLAEPRHRTSTYNTAVKAAWNLLTEYGFRYSLANEELPARAPIDASLARIVEGQPPMAYLGLRLALDGLPQSVQQRSLQTLFANEHPEEAVARRRARQQMVSKEKAPEAPVVEEAEPTEEVVRKPEPMISPLGGFLDDETKALMTKDAGDKSSFQTYMKDNYQKFVDGMNRDYEGLMLKPEERQQATNELSSFVKEYTTSPEEYLNWNVGFVEGVAEFTSGLFNLVVATPIAGWAGLLHSFVYQDPERATQIINSVSDFFRNTPLIKDVFGYEAPSEKGKKAIGAIEAPFVALNSISEAVQDGTLNLTKSPATSTFFGSLIQAIPLLLLKKPIKGAITGTEVSALAKKVGRPAALRSAHAVEFFQTPKGRALANEVFKEIKTGEPSKAPVARQVEEWFRESEIRDARGRRIFGEEERPITPERAAAETPVEALAREPVIEAAPKPVAKAVIEEPSKIKAPPYKGKRPVGEAGKIVDMLEEGLNELATEYFETPQKARGGVRTRLIQTYQKAGFDMSGFGKWLKQFEGTTRPTEPMIGLPLGGIREPAPRPEFLGSGDRPVIAGEIPPALETKILGRGKTPKAELGALRPWEMTLENFKKNYKGHGGKKGYVAMLQRAIEAGAKIPEAIVEPYPRLHKMWADKVGRVYREGTTRPFAKTELGAGGAFEHTDVTQARGRILSPEEKARLTPDQLRLAEAAETARIKAAKEASIETPGRPTKGRAAKEAGVEEAYWGPEDARIERPKAGEKWTPKEDAAAGYEIGQGNTAVTVEWMEQNAGAVHKIVKSQSPLLHMKDPVLYEQLLHHLEGELPRLLRNYGPGRGKTVTYLWNAFKGETAKFLNAADVQEVSFKPLGITTKAGEFVEPGALDPALQKLVGKYEGRHLKYFQQLRQLSTKSNELVISQVLGDLIGEQSSQLVKPIVDSIKTMTDKFGKKVTPKQSIEFLQDVVRAVSEEPPTKGGILSKATREALGKKHGFGESAPAFNRRLSSAFEQLERAIESTTGKKMPRLDPRKVLDTFRATEGKIPGRYPAGELSTMATEVDVLDRVNAEIKRTAKHAKDPRYGKFRKLLFDDQAVRIKKLQDSLIDIENKWFRREGRSLFPKVTSVAKHVRALSPNALLSFCKKIVKIMEREGGPDLEGLRYIRPGSKRSPIYREVTSPEKISRVAEGPKGRQPAIRGVERQFRGPVRKAAGGRLEELMKDFPYLFEPGML